MNKRPYKRMATRHAEYFNALIEDTESYQIDRIKVLGLYVVKSSLYKIAESIGTTTAGLIRPSSPYNSYSELVDDFSGGELELLISKKQKSIIIDKPVLAIAQGEGFPTNRSVPSLSRFEVSLEI